MKQWYYCSEEQEDREWAMVKGEWGEGRRKKTKGKVRSQNCFCFLPLPYAIYPPPFALSLLLLALSFYRKKGTKKAGRKQ
jgi:hypothetical protein